MNEQRRNVSTKAEPMGKEDQKPMGHGDKLEDAVERVAAKGAKKSPDPNKGDEIME